MTYDAEEYHRIEVASRRELNRRLPAWAQGLTTRTKRCLLLEHCSGLLEALTPEAVVAYGRTSYGYNRWGRVNNMGAKSIAELLGLARRLIPKPLWPARAWP